MKKTDFTRVENPMVFFDSVKTGKTTVEEAKNEQEELNEYVEEIQKINK